MIRSMTGRSIFRLKSAGICITVVPAIFDPKPPPQYSETKLMFSGSICSAPANANFVCCELWVETNAWSVSPSQHAMLERGSMGWWVIDWWTIASSMM